MAKTNEYMEEAYSALLELSADDRKRLEYEAREKALKDYNSQMESAFKRGKEQGERCGEKRGIEKTRKIFRLHMQGKGPEEIAGICEMAVQEVEWVLSEE